MEAHLLADSIHGISNRTLSYISSRIEAERTHTLTFTEGLETCEIPHLEQRHSGKVRDVFICKDIVILITTDRQSAFDRNLCSIPFKGQVMNVLSKWWFTHSLHMVPNAFIASPHPNITIAKRCDIFPVEFVIRGYITGSTATSMWTNYANGVRNYCGHNLPEGLVRNQKLSQNLLTPTTKSAEHDALTSGAEIIASGVMTAEQYHTCAHYTHTLFAFGQTECQRRGLILVDTKYEFGLDRADGTIRLVDEVHTPDSSRFWMAHSYEQRVTLGLEPESVDKDILRRWYMAQCDPYDMGRELPEAPPELVNELARRYIMVYEIITGEKWDFTPPAALVSWGDNKAGTTVSVGGSADSVVHSLQEALSQYFLSAHVEEEG